MIWAGISLEAHTDLVFVENSAMTAHRYNEGHGILGSLLLSFQKVSM
jgi:hypothetical protein